MKDKLTDANFPLTADLRVYHLGVRSGEIANRIVTVGSPSRANIVASYLDERPKPFTLSSERGFLTITGRYKGVPISIVSIGMGNANMDFFVREIRECVHGDMTIIRLGSCGALIDIPVGTIVVPQASVAISRNLDFDFVHPETCSEAPYHISKPAPADSGLAEEMRKALADSKPANMAADVVAGTVNASADSFYSSQGRQTSFPDQNADLITHLCASVQNLATLEMETFHLFHLAACWTGRASAKTVPPPPLTTGPVSPTIISKTPNPTLPIQVTSQSPPTVIRAAAVHMVFASRTAQNFITPEEVHDAEHWAGKAVLEALISLDIPQDRLHADQGSVWELV